MSNVHQGIGLIGLLADMARYTEQSTYGINNMVVARNKSLFSQCGHKKQYIYLAWHRNS